MRKLLPYLAAGLLSFPVHATAPVEVVALFKDRAVVRTAAGQQMLKVGETSDFGVTLRAADPYSAHVTYRDKPYELKLTTRVGSRFVAPEQSTVHINRDGQGQYRVRGSINGQFVNFLVDTGASIVAISARQAQALGLQYEAGQPGTVQTAQGVVGAYFMNLDSVTVGGITRNSVRASVIEGDYPTEVLLGMSFLNQVRYQDDNGVLVLTATY